MERWRKHPASTGSQKPMHFLFVLFPFLVCCSCYLCTTDPAGGSEAGVVMGEVLNRISSYFKDGKSPLLHEAKCITQLL